MPFDHYKETEELIEILLSSSFSRFGEALQKAMEEGATGTEILMAIRCDLDELLSEAHCCPRILTKSKKLRDEIDKILY